MKKHDEGYVLAYVTVVLLLFSLIATMILTGAMKNMTAQQDTIQRMKDRYAAEGLIQKMVADIKKNQTPEDQYIEYAEDGTTVVAQLTYKSIANGKIDETGEVPNGWKLVATSGSVEITCFIDSSGNYKTFEIGTVPTGEGQP